MLGLTPLHCHCRLILRTYTDTEVRGQFNNPTSRGSGTISGSVGCELLEGTVVFTIIRDPYILMMLLPWVLSHQTTWPRPLRAKPNLYYAQFFKLSKVWRDKLTWRGVVDLKNEKTHPCLFVFKKENRWAKKIAHPCGTVVPIFSASQLRP